MSHNSKVIAIHIPFRTQLSFLLHRRGLRLFSCELSLRSTHVYSLLQWCCNIFTTFIL